MEKLDPLPFCPDKREAIVAASLSLIVCAFISGRLPWLRTNESSVENSDWRASDGAPARSSRSKHQHRVI